MPPKKEVAPTGPSEIEVFLAARLVGNGWDETGISSNAMIAEAILNMPVQPDKYPHDLSDLSRCCRTFANAPQELQEAMLDRLSDYCHVLDQKIQSRKEV